MQISLRYDREREREITKEFRGGRVTKTRLVGRDRWKRVEGDREKRVEYGCIIEARPVENLSLLAGGRARKIHLPLTGYR